MVVSYHSIDTSIDFLSILLTNTDERNLFRVCNSDRNAK